MPWRHRQRVASRARILRAGMNRLHSNIVWGQRSNYLEVPTDCPQRDERLGWTETAVRDMNDVYYNFLAKDEVKRIERLEIFDELDEDDSSNRWARRSMTSACVAPENTGTSRRATPAGMVS